MEASLPPGIESRKSGTAAAVRKGVGVASYVVWFQQDADTFPLKYGQYDRRAVLQRKERFSGKDI